MNWLNLRMGVLRWQAAQTFQLQLLPLLCDVRVSGGSGERVKLSDWNAAQGDEGFECEGHAKRGLVRVAVNTGVVPAAAQMDVTRDAHAPKEGGMAE